MYIPYISLVSIPKLEVDCSLMKQNSHIASNTIHTSTKLDIRTLLNLTLLISSPNVFKVSLFISQAFHVCHCFLGSHSFL